MFTALCALAAGTSPVSTPKDTVDRYVINGEMVRDFNGSQLKGKTVIDYTIACRDLKTNVERMHVIRTSGSGKEEAPVTPGEKKPVIIVDGKVVSENVMTDMKANDIASVVVYKSDKGKPVTYNGAGDANGVIVVNTKGSKDARSEVEIYVDGKKVDKDDLNKKLKGKITVSSVVSKDGKTLIGFETTKDDKSVYSIQVSEK